MNLYWDLEYNVWQKLSPDGKRRFEMDYGDWNNLSVDERVASLDSFFNELNSKKLIEEQRQEREREYQVLRETIAPLAEAFQSIADGLKDVSYRVAENTNAERQAVSNLETSLTSRERETRDSLGSTQPQQPITLYTAATQKMNCVYDRAKGPKDCIIIETTSEGRYGTCSVGDQVRRKKILPLLFTSALEQTGCPSNTVIRKCDYLVYERVRFS